MEVADSRTNHRSSIPYQQTLERRGTYPEMSNCRKKSVNAWAVGSLWTFTGGAFFSIDQKGKLESASSQNQILRIQEFLTAKHFSYFKVKHTLLTKNHSSAARNIPVISLLVKLVVQETHFPETAAQKPHLVGLRKLPCGEKSLETRHGAWSSGAMW